MDEQVNEPERRPLQVIIHPVQKMIVHSAARVFGHVQLMASYTRKPPYRRCAMTPPPDFEIMDMINPSARLNVMRFIRRISTSPATYRLIRRPVRSAAATMMRQLYKVKGHQIQFCS